MWPFNRSKEFDPRKIRRSGKYGVKKKLPVVPRIVTYGRESNIWDIADQYDNLDPELIKALAKRQKAYIEKHFSQSISEGPLYKLLKQRPEHDGLFFHDSIYSWRCPDITASITNISSGA